MMGTVIRTKKELQNLSQPVSYIAITYSQVLQPLVSDLIT